jgi:hypothetical protein
VCVCVCVCLYVCVYTDDGKRWGVVNREREALRPCITHHTLFLYHALSRALKLNRKLTVEEEREAEDGDRLGATTDEEQSEARSTPAPLSIYHIIHPSIITYIHLSYHTSCSCIHLSYHTSHLEEHACMPYGPTPYWEFHSWRRLLRGRTYQYQV